MSVEVFLQHTFGDFALNAEFAIEKSGITALYGPSGAGKTTIINAIAGLLKPQSGRVVVNGRSLLDTRSGTFVPAHMRGIGYVFQDARLFPHMNVENNLRFGWRRAAVRASESEIAGVISLLGLENLLARGVAKLSGGEKSRVALGRALLCTPGLLLLDEPLAALDGARKAEIFPYLERLRDEAKLPMLYVSHSLDEVTRLAGNVIFLNDGRIMAHGPVGEMVGQTGFGAVLDARVSPRDAGEGLSMLSFDGGELIVSRLMQPAGKRLRVRIRAEDVMLALEEPRGISANNVLPVVVRNLRFGDAGHADVALACGSSLLLARITRASATRLNLKPGLALFAIVKSVTVDPADILKGSGMPLIPYADIVALPDDAREAFERLPRKINIFRMWANAASLFKPGLRFGGAILSRQKLAANLRELVILLVARIEGGEYEWVQHVPIAEAAGCAKAQIAALKADEYAGASFDAREKALLTFAKDVIENVKASEANVLEANKHFSPQEIVEIILTCGFYMTMARLTETTRVDIDPPGGTAIVDELKQAT